MEVAEQKKKTIQRIQESNEDLKRTIAILEERVNYADDKRKGIDHDTIEKVKLKLLSFPTIESVDTFIQNEINSVAQSLAPITTPPPSKNAS